MRINNSLRYSICSLVTILCIGFVFYFGNPPAKAVAAENVRVAIPGLSPNSAFFMVAVQKGYFDAEGIKVEVIRAGGGTAIPAMASGDMQFSASTGSSISAILRGAKLRIVLVGQDRPGTQIWTPHGNIKSIKDLKGQQIGIATRGDTGELAIRKILKSRGLPADYVAYTPMGHGGARLAALKSSQLPATLLNWFEVAALKTGGMPVNAHVVIDIYKDVRMPYNGLATSKKLIDEKPELVRKMMRAALKGVAYVLKFHDESIKLVADYGKLPLAETRFDFERMIVSQLKDGMVSDEMQRSEIALRSELLGLPMDKLMLPSSVFDFSILREVSAKLKSEGWQPSP